MGSVAQMPPRGHYLAHEVGRLAGVSGHTIGQWARRGYIRASQDDGPPKVYSFQDVAESMVVHLLFDRGVRRHEVHEAVRYLREQYGEDWPLSNAELLLSGRQLVLREGQDFLDPGRRGQGMIEPGDLVAIVNDLRRGGWAVRDMPSLRRIEVDPDRLSGRPVIKGRRVPAEDAGRLAQTPEGRRILMTDYDLSSAEIRDAGKWWTAVQEYHAA